MAMANNSVRHPPHCHAPWVITAFILILSFPTRGQVLISIVFGDKLNSSKIEFGLDGGLSLSELSGLPVSQTRAALNLGFYFDFKMRDTLWMIHTGVMVKSSFGARGIPVYALDNTALDAAFAGGSVKRRLSYFNVPVMIKRRLPGRLFVEAGPMIGLMNKGVDEFVASISSDDDLVHSVKIRSQYHPLDFGFIAGLGVRLLKGNGLNIGVRYYLGLTDIEIDDSREDVYNRSFYAYVGLPIGVSSKKKNSNDEK